MATAGQLEPRAAEAHLAPNHLGPGQLSVTSQALSVGGSSTGRGKLKLSSRQQSHHNGSRPATAEVLALTPQQKIEMEQRAEAERAAKAAIYSAEPDEEINLTLWEQAQWHAKIYAIVESGSFPSDIPRGVERAAVTVAILTAVVILLSCASILALSFPVYVNTSPAEWSAVEVFCVIIFTLDLFVRFITCPSKQRFMHDLFNWVDIVSISPFYVGLFGVTDFPWYLRIIRALRIARLVKVLKSHGILGLKDLLRTMSESLTGALLFLIVAGTGTLIFSTMMYFSERGFFDKSTMLWWRPCARTKSCTYNGSAFNITYINTSIDYSNFTGLEVSPFQSIAGSLWFTIDAMTTTGTGEIEGTSMAGRFVTGMMSFAGIFFIGVPTMVLAGNHIAHKVMTTERVVRNTWSDLLRRKRRLLSGILGSLDIVRRYFAWDEEGDCSWEALQEDQDPYAIDDGSKPLGELTPGDAGELTLAIPTGNRSAQCVPVESSSAPSKKGNKPHAPRSSILVGYYRVRDQVREIRQSMIDPTEFLYEPALSLAKNPDGRPRGKVIWANNGQSTLVQFDLVLDDEETRAAVMKAVKRINPRGRIRCDAHSGLLIRHSSPLDALRTQSVDEDGNEIITSITRWTMLPVRARHGFREAEFPIFFKRNGGSWDDPSAHQDDESNYEEQELVDDALSSLLGSGLVVELFVPIPPIRRRVMIVSQFLFCTKLNRELELCAHRAAKDVPYNELTAFITESDFSRLLEGVARRVELIDPSLIVEDLPLVERDIAEVLLRPLRRSKVIQVPQKFARCIYNVEVLHQDDMVFEIPLSLFIGDEDDEVEQDALGYVDITARTAYGRAVRVDFAVSMCNAPPPLEGESDVVIIGGT